MHRIVSNHIVFQLSQPLIDSAHLFPDMKTGEIEGTRIGAVPYTVHNTQLLNNIGFTIEPPILSQYHWPGRFTPYAHQKATAAFLSMNPRCFCLNGMGTGKTLAALWAADFLMGVGVVKQVIIYSPLSTLERVWGDELFINFPHRKFAVLHGDSQKRKKLLKERHDFYIINHDGVEIVADLLAKRSDINLFIVDELAVYRNATTKRWKLLKSLITPDKIVWGMTGSPTPNCLTDAYGQVKLIKPENYTGTFKKFQYDTMVQVSTFRWVPKRFASMVVNKKHCRNGEEIVHACLTPSIRYALEDCVDLPPTIYQTRHATLSATQQKHFNEMLKSSVTSIQGQQVTAVNSAILINKLVQIALGAAYDGNGEVVRIDATERMKVLEDVVEEAVEKVIVFVPLTGALRYVRDHLTAKGYTVEVVDGGVTAGKRNQIFNDFTKADNPHIIVANPKTMAHGLTLVRATTIVWFAPIYDNEIYEQANARIVRPGQKNVTHIVHLASTQTEHNVYKVLETKGNLQQVVLDLAKQK